MKNFFHLRVIFFTQNIIILEEKNWDSDLKYCTQLTGSVRYQVVVNHSHIMWMPLMLTSVMLIIQCLRNLNWEIDIGLIYYDRDFNINAPNLQKLSTVQCLFRTTRFSISISHDRLFLFHNTRFIKSKWLVQCFMCNCFKRSLKKTLNCLTVKQLAKGNANVKLDRQA